MNKKVIHIKVTPDELGYKDRGIMKWQGLILSDQTEALKTMAKEEGMSEPTPKEKINEEAISEVLQLAFMNKAPITMQADIVRNGLYYRDLQYMVLGYANDKIYLRFNDGRQVKSEMHQIRHVEFMDLIEWYEKV